MAVGRGVEWANGGGWGSADSEGKKDPSDRVHVPVLPTCAPEADRIHGVGDK